MHIKKLVTATAALVVVPLVAAQSLANLPTCAQPAIESGITHTTCALTDYTCICGSTGFIDGIKALIQTACSAADQKATLDFANQVCSAAGAALKLDSAPSSPSSAAAAPPAAASAAPQAPANAPPAASNAVAAPPAPSSSYTPPYPSGNGTVGGSTNGTNGTTTPFLGGAAKTSSVSGAIGAAVALGIAVVGLL